MRDKLKSKSPTSFVVVMKPTGPTEEAVLKQMQFLDNVHNLKDKVADACFDDLYSELNDKLASKYMQLLDGCATFTHFAERMLVLRNKMAHPIIVDACEPFRKRYNLDPEFWEQWRAVEKLNADRNLLVHCSVAESADAVLKATRERGKFPQAEAAWSMLGALASYGKAHVDKLDAPEHNRHKSLLACQRQLQHKA
ncbi:hypothetical protein GPECTOR_6g678 [Gonium pectorale]|uniref:Uncharacterized protein n=1 Tax=Gonium pectorale TaxID=33097 RepID=A0A150GV97_GONPE|nr:hypothetical protein GPECTOR_6g678 [Gonium pectorale]|eukprot:KXZ53761.1 hypothetical protein GPECTOR_6g678 [Gonium pectorale]